MQKTSEKKIYLNDCGVVFREEDHSYWLSEKQLSGLTGVIGKHLFPDKYSNVPEAVLRNAAERGSKIHGDIALFDEFGVMESPEVEAYAKVKKKHKFEVVFSEYLVSDLAHFATAIDKILVMDGEVCLGDIKTTYKLDKEYLSWQLSINKYLFELVNPHLEVKGLKGIWVRNGKCEFHDIDIIPKEHVVALLDAEVRGVEFVNPFLVPVSLDRKSVALIQDIADVALQIKSLEAIKSGYEEKINKLFDETGLEKWETDLFTITKKKGYTKETFDSKKFKEENPETYSSYVRTTEVKPTIITKLK